MDAASEGRRVLRYRTSEPSDLIPRVLDFARKASIKIEGLRMTRSDDRAFDLVFEFEPTADRKFETLRSRCQQIRSSNAF